MRIQPATSSLAQYRQTRRRHHRLRRLLEIVQRRVYAETTEKHLSLFLMQHSLQYINLHIHFSCRDLPENYALMALNYVVLSGLQTE
jgi:hypothetical protein